MPTYQQDQRRVTKGGRIVIASVAVVVLLLVLAALSGWLFLRASLPQLDGNRSVAGLTASASISRDALGSVTIRASNRPDLAFATGFAQAQDRFFQMDLLRRTAAGELSALVGPAALPTDERNRLNRFRARAEQSYAGLPADQRLIIQRYTDGVNAGLAASGARPFEYAVLRTAPKPWQPADTLLVIYAMYLDLQSGELERVLSRGVLRDSVPPDLLAFLTPAASHWDTALDGKQPPSVSFNVPPTRPDWLDAASLSSSDNSNALTPYASALGSNGWAVEEPGGSGSRALVANDMHLGLRLPNIWYRLTLEFPDSDGHMRRISGVSLPGAPVIVAGSNGDVAWGFTSSFGHFIDLVQLQRDPADPQRYRGPTGEWEQASEHIETIAVKGGPDLKLPVLETRWGPMLEVGGKTYAKRWIAYLPSATDFGLIRMETAHNVPAALRIAQTSGIPTENIVVADSAGHIGWTLAGPLLTAPLDPHGFPVSAANANAPFARLPAAAYPQIIDPPGGLLWTANNTQLGDLAQQAKIGDGGADLGARATQIHNDLLALKHPDERELLKIQLDDRAQWLTFWRALALTSLDDAATAGHPDRAAFKRIVTDWNSRADADAAGYTLVKDFYQSLYDAWFGGLDARLATTAPGLSVRRASSRLEPVMESLAQQHAWVPARLPDWRAFLLERIDAVIARDRPNGASLDDAHWGERNRLAMVHPFAQMLPAPLRGWLSAPAAAMPGDINMPRVQGRAFGASERFVVEPGHEENGILEMPGGASGHPLSPYFLAGHEAWVKGEASAFLPGGDVHRLVLMPAAR